MTGPADDGHLRQVREAERLVGDIEQTRDELRAVARARLGLAGAAAVGQPVTEPLRRVLRTHGLGWYPLLALGVLAIVDTFQSYAFIVLTPEIARTLGVGRGAVAGVIALKTVAISGAPLVAAALAQREGRRAWLCILGGVAWSLVSISTGLVTAMAGLALVLVIDGLTTGTVQALHRPLLVDSYPPEARMRSLSLYQGADSAGNVLAPLLVAALVGVLGFTWRGVFLVLGTVSFLAVLFASRLRDPGFGTWDAERIRQAVQEHTGSTGGTHRDVPLGFFEIVRRLFLIPTVRRLLAGFAVFGVLLVPLQTFVFFFLDERWGLEPGERALFFAGMAAIQIGVLSAFGRWGERLFRADPGRPVRVAGTAMALGVVGIALGGLSPVFAGTVAAFAAAFACLAVVSPALFGPYLSVIPARMRPHASALTGIFLGAVGGLGGALFLSGIDRRFGITGSIVSMLVPGVVGALILRSAGRLLPADLDRMIDEVVEDEEVRTIVDSGRHLPMLACRGVDFSYGQLQVLFGVDFTVDDGEMVALLGVNGAGKSTLLKVVSGIGLPSTGTVRFGGSNITYLDAERRVRLGITQVPGGRAVFGPMSVVDNLRVYGATVRRNRRAFHAALDECFEAFPRLAERRNQPASTLSGGEQQMLALSKALILEPRLLLIDELSLGLAPVVVGQLLEMVRRINAAGTAVVLVEQSVNIALNLVDHAYFMEKGEVRFDGNAADLLVRDDLLRAVFLQGAGAAG